MMRSTFGMFVFVALVSATALAQEQIGTWTVGQWTDPATGASQPAIRSGTDYGLDGEVIFACDTAAELGLTLILSADALADDAGEPLMVGAKFDLEPEVGPWTDWTRGADGSTVTFGGDPEQLRTIVEEMGEAVSPVFMVAFGPIEDGFHMFVLESEDFASALASLPCGI